MLLSERGGRKTSTKTTVGCKPDIKADGSRKNEDKGDTEGKEREKKRKKP